MFKFACVLKSAGLQSLTLLAGGCLFATAFAIAPAQAETVNGLEKKIETTTVSVTVLPDSAAVKPTDKAVKPATKASPKKLVARKTKPAPAKPQATFRRTPLSSRILPMPTMQQ